MYLLGHLKDILEKMITTNKIVFTSNMSFKLSKILNKKIEISYRPLNDNLFSCSDHFRQSTSSWSIICVILSSFHTYRISIMLHITQTEK